VQYELIRALCAAGAEANGVDDDGLPVATAIGFGQRESLRALVEAGARLDNVMFAAAAGDVGLVERMVGPDLELRPPHVDCTIDWFAGQSEPAWQLERAFVLAAGFGQAGVVRLLLERGVPIDCAPRGGETALHSAAFHGRLEVVELLLERGARADLRDGNYHGTPFGWAHEGKRRDVIERLAEHRTPDLFDAASCHLIRAVREHLERDPSLVDAPEGRGGLLLWAARSGSLALTELLLEFGAKRDVRDPKGKSPVELAEAGGHAEVAERLRST